MSEVISFRLDKENPREAKALMVLKNWQRQGHNIRYIITEAILNMGHSQNDEIEPEIFHTISGKLDIVTSILEQLSSGGEIFNDRMSGSNQSKMTLPDNFIASIKSNAKIGYKLSDGD